MPLDPLARAFLGTVDRLTRDTYDSTDGESVLDELRKLGFERDEVVLWNLSKRLVGDGYLDHNISFAGGMDFRSTAFIQLTELGRDAAWEVDPFQRTHADTWRLLASDDFRGSYPGAFERWADAERLLWSDDVEAQLTTIGHKVREAMQLFATAMVSEHRPPNPETNPALVERRLGSVIALHRAALGESRRKALEALGDLWEAAGKLVQRQEHGAQKEAEAVTWTDARRLVWLTMFLMVEFHKTFEDLPAPPSAA